MTTDQAVARQCARENLLQEALDAVRAYMDAVRFAQDKTALMSALKAADDQARAVLAKSGKEQS